MTSVSGGRSPSPVPRARAALERSDHGPAGRFRPGSGAGQARGAPDLVVAGADGAELAPLGPDDVLELQRVVGNAAVSRSMLRPLVGAGPDRPRDRTRVVGDTVGIQRVVEDRPETHSVLRRGDTGPEVEQLQGRLNDEGVAEPALEVDGIFGGLTSGAVREFQARHGLAVDGVVGIRTWGVLDELARRGIAGPTSTVLDETTPVDAIQQGIVTGILHAGDSGGGGTGEEMTGTGPGGTYEQGVIDALNDLATLVIGSTVANPAVDMSHANRVGDRAQEEVEAFFGSSITLASRAPTGDWHPGSSRMGLADATTRQVSEGDVLGWANYFMDNSSYEPSKVALAHHYDGTRARPDKAEHDRVRDRWLAQGGRQKTRQMIRSWPAEAGSGTVYLQLGHPGYQDRVGMWVLFATLVHEFLHLVTHPSYDDAAALQTGGASDVLIEGMDEHMAAQVWEDVLGRIAGDTTLRVLVEGPFAGPIANTADYAPGAAIDEKVKEGRYASMAGADQIAETVGEENVRAAYFMGHVEAIGLSTNPALPPGLGAMAAGGGQPGRYTVPAGGETVGEIRRRTGSAQVEDVGGSVWVDESHRFAAGEELRIPGLRWHTAIAEDTRAQVANQHGITQEALERANRLAHAAGATRITPGRVLMIPVSS